MPHISHFPHDPQSRLRTAMASATSGSLPPANATTFEVSTLFRSASRFAMTLAQRLVARLVCFLARISEPKASESATACRVVIRAVSGRAGLHAALSGCRQNAQLAGDRNDKGRPPKNNPLKVINTAINYWRHISFAAYPPVGFLNALRTAP